MENGKEGLAYTDDDGIKMFGFSQTSLDKNTEATDKMRIVVRNSVIFLGLFIIWLVYYVIHNNVLNNTLSIVARCV